ncbi:transporter [Chitinispirillum alkaliphilum]|nr:transporter [Chitinispirillum alkaliphilum]
MVSSTPILSEIKAVYMNHLVLLIGFTLLFVCIAVQAIVTTSLILLLNRLYNSSKHNRGSVYKALVFEGAAIMLIFSFLLQVSIWAVAYVWIGEFQNFSTAFYFSGVTYATLGYGDIVLSQQWRILGVFQSLNGLIMGGFAASVFFSISSRIFRRERKMGKIES